LYIVSLGACLSTPNSQKKGYGRPKSAEPGSPLLRRALSPDRLHPRSAESKTSISPLANTVVKVTPRVTIAQSSHNSSEISDESNDGSKDGANDGAKIDKKMPCEQKADYSKLAHNISINLSNVSMSNSCGSTQLPRIAEEKDSPTGIKSDDYSSSSSSKEANTEKRENKQHRASLSRGNHRSDDTAGSEEARSDEARQSTAGGSGKVTQRCNRMEENVTQSGPAPRTSAHNSHKNFDQQRHKAHVTEQRGGIAKGNTEIQQEAKKMLKRYKTDVGDNAHPST